MPLSETPLQWRVKTWNIIHNGKIVGEVGRCKPSIHGANSWYFAGKYKGGFGYFKTKNELIKGLTQWLASYVKPKKT